MGQDPHCGWRAARKVVALLLQSSFHRIGSMWVTKGRKAPVPKFARNAPIILLVGLGSVLAADPRGNVVVIDGELRDDFWRQVDPGKLTPTEAGVPREAGGEVRAILSGRYLYLGARV